MTEKNTNIITIPITLEKSQDVSPYDNNNIYIYGNNKNKKKSSFMFNYTKDEDDNNINYILSDTYSENDKNFLSGKATNETIDLYNKEIKEKYKRIYKQIDENIVFVS